MDAFGDEQLSSLLAIVDKYFSHTETTVCRVSSAQHAGLRPAEASPCSDPLLTPQRPPHLWAATVANRTRSAISSPPTATSSLTYLSWSWRIAALMDADSGDRGETCTRGGLHRKSHVSQLVSPAIFQRPAQGRVRLVNVRRIYARHIYELRARARAINSPIARTPSRRQLEGGATLPEAGSQPHGVTASGHSCTVLPPLALYYHFPLLVFLAQILLAWKST